MDRIAVVGAGSWGTTVAAMCASRANTTLWARRPELAEEINLTRTNPAYLPELELPKGLTATADLDSAVAGADLIVMAVPSHGFREVFARTVPHISERETILSLTKGIEQDSLSRMSEVVSQESGHDPALIGVMTGPNLAAEIASGQPTAAVVAIKDSDAATALQSLFMSETFRVYTNDDVVGCELGGALKNVMAIASGMSDGLGFGDNTRATLLTRALAELTRLGVALGGRPETFAGLAGMGDLIATCSSTRSRNHQVGVRLAKGQSIDEIISEMKMVAEGVKTTSSVMGLAEQTGVEMPIAAHVKLVLEGTLTPAQGLRSLMTREAKPESI